MLRLNDQHNSSNTQSYTTYLWAQGHSTPLGQEEFGLVEVGSSDLGPKCSHPFPARLASGHKRRFCLSSLSTDIAFAVFGHNLRIFIYWKYIKRRFLSCSGAFLIARQQGCKSQSVCFLIAACMWLAAGSSLCGCRAAAASVAAQPQAEQGVCTR